jgi:hypothetical protein
MKNIFNTIFIILGFLIVFSAFGPSTSNPGNTFLTGVTTIIGAFAYKSAKLRKIKEVPDTKIRLGFELFGILVIFLLIALSSRHHLKELIANDPIHFVIPVIAIIAYIYKAFKKE